MPQEQLMAAIRHPPVVQSARRYTFDVADAPYGGGESWTLSPTVMDRPLPKKAFGRNSMMIMADFSGATESTDTSPRHSGRSFQSYLNEKAIPDPPYHVFERSRKKQLVYIVSLAGLFSPLSSNIYFPALSAIALDLQTTVALVTLTITVYMVVQGLAPSFWGAMSDSIGRRPVFVGTFVVYLIACAGLGLSKSFAALMFFRGLQAAGSAATISIGGGVIGDITTAADRGGLIGVFGGIRMLGQSVGPVLGGVLTQFLGFRSIFWFLLIFGTFVLFLIMLLLPETLRVIAGNGTIRLTGIYQPFIYKIIPQADVLSEPDPNAPRPTVSIGSIFSPLKFLGERDVFITLLYGSIIYTVWSMVTASTTALFTQRYGLDSLLVGLAFLPNGAGCVLGSYLTGRLMDHDYHFVEQQYRISHNLPVNQKLNRKALVDFPLEQARLRNIWWIVLTFVATTATYGFSLNTNIALPLVLQFFIAYTATAVFSINSVLIIDLYPGASASATAVNNLARCSVGAAGVALIQPLLDAIGPSTAFALLAALAALLSPCLLVEWKWGAAWRWERTQRLERQKVAKEAAKRDVEKGLTPPDRA